MELHTIVVGRVKDHPYWKTGSFVALDYEGEWGPSPTLRQVDVPVMFLSAQDAQDVIDEHNGYGVSMKVLTFVKKAKT